MEMAKINLSWLKLDVNVLDDTKIKIINTKQDYEEAQLKKCIPS